jgi:hypothetical protein
MPAARVLTIGWLAASCVCPSAMLSAEEPQVVIRTSSGRTFSGALDGRSSAKQAVIRTQVEGITLWRSIHWEAIVSSTVDSKEVGLAALQKTAIESKVERRPVSRKIEMRADLPANPRLDDEPHDASPPPRVQTIGFDAYVANWDADVETDGLEIDIAPLDADRRVLPVQGTLEVELFVPERRKLELAPLSGGDTLELVERWTRALTPDDFRTGVARFRLPFGAITPELRPNWTASHYGLVHVRLAAPGHGVFDDTRDGIRVRPWAPNRDRLEMKTGQRFLSTEHLGRHE